MNSCPIPGARGTLMPEGTGANGVLVLGEACGEHEAKAGLPFRPDAPAGSVLERAIRRIGATREQFVLWNVVPVQPPKNWLEGAPWEAESIEWGRPQLEHIIATFKPRAILALGNVAVRATTGLCGRHLGVAHLSGYVLPGLKPSYPPVVACFHPAYMRRSKMSLLSVLMRTLKLAMLVAREGRQALSPPLDSPPPGYILHPTEEVALEFERQTRDINPVKGFLAYDIETAYSTVEEDAEERPDAIRSIQFSLSPGSGIYLPWRWPYIGIARRLLAGHLPKLSWNGWHFDRPLLSDNGCPIVGVEHDLMWAWHHAQPDLPRGLQFAAAMQGPDIYQPTHSWPWIWKNLDKQSPEFYGIVDVDVLQWLINYR